jgi:YD repeat-containing protein
MALIDGLHNIGDAIREKTGTSDLIPFKDIPQAILSISGGGSSGDSGVVYTDIVYNDDNTITLTDKDGITHTMVCTYDDAGKLVEVTYEDGKVVEMTYEGEDLTNVGNTVVKLSGYGYAPTREEITITDADTLFMTVSGTASGNTYELYKVNDGLAICGYGKFYTGGADKICPLSISDKYEDCLMSVGLGGETMEVQEFIYNGGIWYVCSDYSKLSYPQRCTIYGGYGTSVGIVHSSSGAVPLAKLLLDYYFYKEVSE